MKIFKKIKQWFSRKKNPNLLVDKPQLGLYTTAQVENAYELGYTDGKRDGLTIAREQATKSLKDILWQQNKSQK